MGFCHSALIFWDESIYNRNVLVRHCMVEYAQRLLWLKMHLDALQSYEHIWLAVLNERVVRCIKKLNNFLFIKKYIALQHS